jgi:hypothetical protein
MGIFDRIWSKVSGKATPASRSTTSTASPGATTPTSGGAGAAPMSGVTGASSSTAPAVVDVEAIMMDLEAKSGHKSNWRTSIVDLMSLLGMENSLAERRELATELGYTGDMSDTATMNIWLHKQVMKQMAANGGKVPAHMLD